MMKKIILLLVLGVLVLSGCTTDQGDVHVLTTAFYGGSEGVSIEFKDIAPPEQFDQGEDVPVRVLLKNKGEYDILAGNAKAKIYGINTEVFNLPSEYKPTTGILRGKGEFNIDGGEQEINFDSLNYGEDVINSRDFTIRAKVCYPYQTKTEVPVCIKTSLSEESGEGVCSVSGEKVVDGSVSSAPIQVTSVKEVLRGSNQVRFDMTVENKGVGDVYANDVSCEDLEDDLTRLNNKNRIYLEVINPQNVECGFISGEDSDKGLIELNDNKKVVSCNYEASDTYEDTLRVVFSYVYTDTTSKQITIYEV